MIHLAAETKIGIDAIDRMEVVPINSRLSREVIEPQWSSTIFGRVLQVRRDPLRLVVAFWDDNRHHLLP